MTSTTAAPTAPGTIGAPAARLGRRVALTFVASLAAQVTGSAFNIWYNMTHIRPLLTPAQAEAFAAGINLFNLSVYPPALGLWLALLWSLARAARVADPVRDAARWHRAQRRAVNLPWYIVGIAGPAWMLTIPALLAALHYAPGSLDPQVPLHLTASVVVSALIALTHLFFVVELVGQRLWFPVFFAGEQPSRLPGTVPLTLRRRGLFFAASAVACPIVALLLISVAAGGGASGAGFPLTVGAIGIVFGVVSAWMLGRIVGEPVERLRHAAERVAAGDLSPETEIRLLRADEFGVLIDRFNRMVADLRGKRRVEEVLGRHVDPRVARILLSQDSQVRGRECEITVLFTDIRGFTARCGSAPPTDVVGMLNLYYEVMVERVEAHGGIVNEFAGDGFMAIFGAIEDGTTHAAHAVAAGLAMLDALPDLNARLIGRGLPPIEIGIGINTGRTIVGAIGAPRRSSLTAVGDMVPVAARIEAVTKEVGHSLLFSDRTYAALADPPPVVALPPRPIRGRPDPVRLYAPGPR